MALKDFYHQQCTVVQKTSINRHHIYLQESACVVASRQIMLSRIIKGLVYFMSGGVYKVVPFRLTRSMECCKKKCSTPLTNGSGKKINTVFFEDLAASLKSVGTWSVNRVYLGIRWDTFVLSQQQLHVT